MPRVPGNSPARDVAFFECRDAAAPEGGGNSGETCSLLDGGPLLAVRRRAATQKHRRLHYLAAAAGATALVGACLMTRLRVTLRPEQPRGSGGHAVSNAAEVAGGKNMAYISLTQHPGKCLDVTDGVDQGGNAIQIWDCDARRSKQFLVAAPGRRGRIQWAQHRRFCLDVPGFGPNSSEMMLWECDKGKPSHLEFLVPDGNSGTLRMASDASVCLRVIDNNITNGQRLHVRTCGDDAPEFTVMHPGDCAWADWTEWSACSVNCGGGVRARARRAREGAAFFCNSSDSVTEGCNGEPCKAASDAFLNLKHTGYITVTEHPTKCLDVSGDAETPGSAIQVWDCGNLPDMQFLMAGPGENGLIRWHQDPTLCLDVPPDGQIMTWPCEEVAKQPHMLFSMPAGAGGKYAGAISMVIAPDKHVEITGDNFTSGHWVQVSDGLAPAGQSFTIYSPVDCGWQAWSAWSACSAACGKGTRTRKRAPAAPEWWVWSAEKGAFELQACSDTDLEEPCNPEQCPGSSTLSASDRPTSLRPAPTTSTSTSTTEAIVETSTSTITPIVVDTFESSEQFR